MNYGVRTKPWHNLSNQFSNNRIIPIRIQNLIRHIGSVSPTDHSSWPFVSAISLLSREPKFDSSRIDANAKQLNINTSRQWKEQ